MVPVNAPTRICGKSVNNAAVSRGMTRFEPSVCAACLTMGFETGHGRFTSCAIGLDSIPRGARRTCPTSPSFRAMHADTAPCKATIVHRSTVCSPAAKRIGLSGGGSQVPDPREFRFRYLVGIVLAAILIAALLRHVLHVYAGLSREDIRADALIAVLVTVGTTILIRRLSRR